MFWQLDPNSQPPAVKYEQEITLEMEKQEKLRQEQEKQNAYNYYD